MELINNLAVLFVDDEPEILNSLRRFLRKEPYHALFADSGRKALDVLGSHPVDIIVSDLRMPEMDGLTLLRRVKDDFPEVIRLILSATQELEQVNEALHCGEIFRFIPKPMDPQLFRQIIHDAVCSHRVKDGRKDGVEA
jgi:sigma-B regulation protein RsbU (phosphoserine phosphatase)